MDNKLQSLILEKGKDLQALVEEEKTKEFHYRVGELKLKLPRIGRCTICTLKLPCKHFASLEDMPKLEEEISETAAIYSAVQGLTLESIPEKEILQKDRSFTVRYRGKDTNYSQANHARQSSLPSSQKLKILERVEAYREEKIQKEIGKIKSMKDQEESRAVEEKKRDEKRRKHAMQLRMKIEQFKEEYQIKREQIKGFIEEERNKKLAEEEKRKKYLDIKKKELAEYVEKKNLLERISKMQARSGVEALSNKNVAYH